MNTYIVYLKHGTQQARSITVTAADFEHAAAIAAAHATNGWSVDRIHKK